MTNPLPNRFAQFCDGDIDSGDLDDAEANALVACSLGHWVSFSHGFWSFFCVIRGEVLSGHVNDYSSDWAHAGPLAEKGRFWLIPQATGVWGCFEKYLGNESYDARPTRAIVNAHLEKWRLGMKEMADA